MSKLAAIEAKRAAKQAALQSKRDDQRATDLEALDALETEHGLARVSSVDVPYTPGLPTLAAVRCPTEAEIKRYRARVRPRKDGTTDLQAAAEEMAESCLIYPADAAVYAQMQAMVPGLHGQLGVEALGLAVGKAAAEGKG